MYCLFVNYDSPKGSSGGTNVPPPVVEEGDLVTINCT